MLHVERFDLCTACLRLVLTVPYPGCQYLSRGLQVETLDLCTDMRAVVRAHIVVGLLGSHLQASSGSAKPTHGPHESLHY